jgi:hypothetical protein
MKTAKKQTAKKTTFALWILTKWSPSWQLLDGSRSFSKLWRMVKDLWPDEREGKYCITQAGSDPWKKSERLFYVEYFDEKETVESPGRPFKNDI